MANLYISHALEETELFILRKTTSSLERDITSTQYMSDVATITVSREVTLNG